jgi:hypothetical protein
LKKDKLSVIHTATPLAQTHHVPKTIPPPSQPIHGKNADPNMDLIKAFLLEILASPDDMKDPSFFQNGVGSSTIGDLLQQTAAKIEKKKEDDKKREEAVSAALRVERHFPKTMSYLPIILFLRISKMVEAVKFV